MNKTKNKNGYSDELDSRALKELRRERWEHLLDRFALPVFIALIIVLFISLMIIINRVENPVQTATPTATVAPTATATPTATAAPTATPAPTPTPIPAGWYVDPRGIIPPEVEILVPEPTDQVQPWAFCIARNEAGEIVLQKWQGGLQAELSFPELELFLGKKTIMASYYKGEIIIDGFETETYYMEEEYLMYYEMEGYYFCLEVNSRVWNGNTLMLATTDGKAIMWEVGEPTYQMHTFGEGDRLEVTSNCNFMVNGSAVWDIEWEEYPMKER